MQVIGIDCVLSKCPSRWLSQDPTGPLSPPLQRGFWLICRRTAGLLMGLSLAVLTQSALASPITYDVSVNTSSLAGTTGSLDFNFNPGPLTTQGATLQIQGLNGGIVSGSAALTGDASGSLPGTVTLDNGTAFNDYFQNFAYGSTLSFDISLSGPALSSPNGTATSGSAFAFSMFSDTAGTIPALTSDLADGFALTANVNLDGSVTVDNFSTETTFTTATGGGGTSVPEPGTFGLAAVGFALILLTRFRRRRSN